MAVKLLNAREAVKVRDQALEGSAPPHARISVILRERGGWSSVRVLTSFGPKFVGYTSVVGGGIIRWKWLSPCCTSWIHNGPPAGRMTLCLNCRKHMPRLDSVSLSWPSENYATALDGSIDPILAEIYLQDILAYVDVALAQARANRKDIPLLTIGLDAR